MCKTFDMAVEKKIDGVVLIDITDWAITTKAPVKLIKRVKIILQMAVKEFFEIHF